MSAAPPVEYRDAIDRTVSREPEHLPGPVTFERTRPPSDRGFTLRSFLRPHRVAVAGGITLVAVETLARQAGPLLMQRAIDHGVLAKDFGAVVVASLLFVVSIIIAQVITTVRIKWTGYVGQRLIKQLRIRVFTHLQRLSQSFFTSERVGRVLTRMTSDIDALQQLLQDGFVNLVVQGFTLLIVVGVMFNMNVRLATIVVTAIMPVMVVMTLWFRSASERTYAEVRERIAELLADLQENLSGHREITAYNRTDHNRVAHRNIVGTHREAKIASGRVQGIYSPTMDAIGVVGQVVVLLLGGRMVLRGELSIGELTAFVMYLAAFFAPIQQLVNLYNTYQSGQAAVHKINDLLATEPTVIQSDDAVDLPTVEGAIDIDNVTFEYLPGRPVLKHVRLHIAPGETVALVGPTGAGKSTLAKLMTRTYDPLEGVVSVDGHNLRTVTIDSLRRQVGVVPQEPFLFTGSIRDNLQIGRPEATDDELLETCRMVGLDTLLGRLPDGLDADVSERGATLSSGERQLLALARAMLTRPRVVVLDEATSNLDLQSEAAVERALDVLLEGRTAVIIAHRLSTARRADRVVVVADGGIAEMGTHDELLAAGGRYHEMFTTWTEHAQVHVG